MNWRHNLTNQMFNQWRKKIWLIFFLKIRKKLMWDLFVIQICWIKIFTIENNGEKKFFIWIIYWKIILNNYNLNYIFNFMKLLTILVFFCSYFDLFTSHMDKSSDQIVKFVENFTCVKGKVYSHHKFNKDIWSIEELTIS